METVKTVTVKQLPQALNLARVRTFMREIDALLKQDRPRIVFDFSQVRQLDSAGAEMLLQCLEHVMKRDGDIKLAAVPPASEVILELTRVDRLFEIFDSVDDAVESFHGYRVRPAQEAPAAAWYSPETPASVRASDELGLAS